MLGAIAGDIIGSRHEGGASPGRDFTLFHERSCFSDDTVLNIAVADALLNDVPYAISYRHWARRYPYAGYGHSFQTWFESDHAGPYNSRGNGSAMRVAPLAWACNSLADVLWQAEHSALPTHNHPEGVRGALAIAAAIFAARQHWDRAQIRSMTTDRFGYACCPDIASLQALGPVDVRCQSTVPAAISAFLLSRDFEDAVRLAVSLGGDADTVACITGAIAEAYYGGVPETIRTATLARLDPDLCAVVARFTAAHGIDRGHRLTS